MLSSVGLNHRFKGSGVIEQRDTDGLSKLNETILKSAEFGLSKMQLFFEVLEDTALFLVCFVSIFGVFQYIKG